MAEHTSNRNRARKRNSCCSGEGDDREPDSETQALVGAGPAADVAAGLSGDRGPPRGRSGHRAKVARVANVTDPLPGAATQAGSAPLQAAPAAAGAGGAAAAGTNPQCDADALDPQSVLERRQSAGNTSPSGRTPLAAPAGLGAPYTAEELREAVELKGAMRRRSTDAQYELIIKRYTAHCTAAGVNPEVCRLEDVPKLARWYARYCKERRLATSTCRNVHSALQAYVQSCCTRAGRPRVELRCDEVYSSYYTSFCYDKQAVDAKAADAHGAADDDATFHSPTFMREQLRILLPLVEAIAGGVPAVAPAPAPAAPAHAACQVAPSVILTVQQLQDIVYQAAAQAADAVLSRCMQAGVVAGAAGVAAASNAPAAAPLPSSAAALPLGAPCGGSGSAGGAADDAAQAGGGSASGAADAAPDGSASDADAGAGAVRPAHGIANQQIRYFAALASYRTMAGFAEWFTAPHFSEAAAAAAEAHAAAEAAAAGRPSPLLAPPPFSPMQMLQLEEADPSDDARAAWRGGKGWFKQRWSEVRAVALALTARFQAKVGQTATASVMDAARDMDSERAALIKPRAQPKAGGRWPVVRKGLTLLQYHDFLRNPEAWAAARRSEAAAAAAAAVAGVAGAEATSWEEDGEEDV